MYCLNTSNTGALKYLINCEVFENSYQIKQMPRKQNKVKIFFLLEMQVAV